MKALKPFQSFFHTESAGGVVLLVSGCAAIAMANSPWASYYHDVWRLPISVAVAGRELSVTLHQWINDGLMAIFFLLVGLEIKRELIAGELATPRQAALPIAGAIGGMVVPAVTYWVFNPGGVASRGWGIPMATDIAFALSALSIIAPSAPLGARVFLAALAIVDDMGAVIVIALFYTQEIAWPSLAIAAGIVVMLIALNRLGVRRLSPYLLCGIALWVFVHESGIHATIAGVLLALTIPIRTRIDAAEFSREARELLDEFDRTETGDFLVLTSKPQQEALFSLERASEGVTDPLLRLEHALHSFSTFAVMPIFAFANAGVSLAGVTPDVGVTTGAALGLIVGKPAGIMAASYAAIALGRASLPAEVTLGTLHGCAWLGGIGFTMSLFIAALAFGDSPELEAAKTGIILGSVIAGIVATVMLRRAIDKGLRPV